ncbi:TIGR03089 family protein [Brooklawnia sp.]|uniref:TIGR03089 family protein n=1 Tax=Brooklawnia sp. TaxID=2699740 RepID=UPI00311EE89B
MAVRANTPPISDLLAALEDRVARAGSGPLITWYDLDKGFRTELSGRTFANWVDKSANLLVSMDVEELPRVANTLLVTDSGHWVGLVWTMAIWQLGGQVVASPRERLASTDLLDAAIVGPADPHPVPGVETIACSLHPLGGGFESRPDGVTDYAEVLSQPDVHWRVPPEDPVCFEGECPQRWDDLANVSPTGERVLLQPGPDPWTMVCRALAAPILGGGSAVIAVGGESGQLASLARQERAVLR